MGKRWHIIATLTVFVSLSCAAAGSGTIEIPLISWPGGGQYHYQGVFKLDGHFYWLRLAGRPASTSGEVEFQMVYFTADRDEGYTDWGPFPHVLGLKGQLFNVVPNGGQRKLTLTPFMGQTGSVGVTMDTERLSLRNKDGGERVLLYRPGRTVRVPEGRYLLHEYQLVRKDQQGIRWYVCARGSEKSPVLAVQKEGTAVLSIGEPYVPCVEIPVRTRGYFWGFRTEAVLNFVLQGAWKENANQVFPISGKSRPNPPKYLITDTNGRVVTQGRFEYG